MMILLLILLALPLFLLFLLRNRRRTPLPPGPPGLPLIGNLLQLDKSAPHIYLWRLSKQYGPLMILRLGFVPTLVVSSARMAKEVMKTHDLEFSGRPSLLGLRKLSYNGLDVAFSPYNDYWREMRKICVLHLFNSKRAQSFRPIREDEVLEMIKKISQFASASKLTNLSEILISLTSTIICRVAFSKRYDDEGYERSRFQKLVGEGQAVVGGFYFSDYFPLMGWVDKLTGMIALADKNFKEFDLFYQEIIDEHLDPNRPEPEKEDITDVLLKLQKNRLFTIDLTFDHIKAVLMNIFLAGTDTSAATLVWAMTMLMKNPRTMTKAQEELRNLIGKKGFVDEDDLQKLPYLKAIVKETMRLHPASPLLVPRETLEKCVIDGYEIPPKTLVYVNAWAIGRDPESWENPEEFMPERFLGTSIDFKGQDYQLIPFGGGRRICPGLNLGAAMVELTLANLLYSFDWEMPAGMNKEDIDIDVKPGITMHKKNALCLLARIPSH
ncbi:6,7,8-trihydroxycoumarin synthase [Vitis vinifera]|uniref:Cytochrome P450 83B1 n=1 Tax=Vitis vinifera TaxID=29760 RepID=F6H064_VITVI|nr:6,7,8-trihydroxycoumarin synthase [Vitis vinifera]|eukprot:XP_002278300.1 PREDICTED: cytochrome P450 71A1 [Vitis vinifera]